jgi:hypothetical protein
MDVHPGSRGQKITLSLIRMNTACPLPPFHSPWVDLGALHAEQADGAARGGAAAAGGQSRPNPG